MMMVPPEWIGHVSLIAFSLQLGLHPFVYSHFVSKSVSKVSIVLVTEIAKILLAFGMLVISGEVVALGTISRKTFCLSASPALVYVVQNMLLQYGFELLDYTSFTILYQTKIIFTAGCLYLAMGKKQSKVQMCALVMLVISAAMLTTKPGFSHDVQDLKYFTLTGASAAIGGAMLSGFAATLCQYALQHQELRGRPAVLFTVELAMVSIVTVIMGSILTSSTTSSSSTYVPMSRWTETLQGLFDGWTPWTCIPVLLQASTGISAGIVTRYAGSLRKGFASVVSILVTVGGDWLLYIGAKMWGGGGGGDEVGEGKARDGGVQLEPWRLTVAVGFVVTATYLHTFYPPVVGGPKKLKLDKGD